jgi:hypothetical protein
MSPSSKRGRLSQGRVDVTRPHLRDTYHGDQAKEHKNWAEQRTYLPISPYPARGQKITHSLFPPGAAFFKLAAYRDSGGLIDAHALHQCLIARAAVMSAWYPILYPDPSPDRISKLRARLDWLAGDP